MAGFIYYSLPEEIRDHTDNSILKSLLKEMNQEILDLLFVPIKKSIKFTNKVEIRSYAIELAKQNEAILKNDSNYFYLEFGVHKGESATSFQK